jgi:hypothetical protein
MKNGAHGTRGWKPFLRERVDQGITGTDSDRRKKDFHVPPPKAFRPANLVARKSSLTSHSKDCLAAYPQDCRQFGCGEELLIGQGHRSTYIERIASSISDSRNER